MTEHTRPSLPTKAEMNTALTQQLSEDAESLRMDEETFTRADAEAVDDLVEQIKVHGHHAEVQDSGGGVSVIVAGRQAINAAGDLRWSAVLDPDDLHLGISPGYDLDAPGVPVPAWSTFAEIADLVAGVVEWDTRPMLFPEPGSKVRFPQNMAGTLDPDGWEQPIDVPAGTVGVYQRPVGFPYMPADGWIWATVDLESRHVWVPAGPDMYEHIPAGEQQ